MGKPSNAIPELLSKSIGFSLPSFKPRPGPMAMSKDAEGCPPQRIQRDPQALPAKYSTKVYTCKHRVN